jgi:hypothetical protein
VPKKTLEYGMKKAKFSDKAVGDMEYAVDTVAELGTQAASGLVDAASTPEGRIGICVVGAYCVGVPMAGRLLRAAVTPVVAPNFGWYVAGAAASTAATMAAQAAISRATGGVL